MPVVSVQRPRSMTADRSEPSSSLAAVIERDGRFLVTRRLRARISPATGSFPAASASPANRTRRASSASYWRNWASAARSATKYWSPNTRIPIGRCGCISGDARSSGEPRPLLGQEMRWVTREELRSWIPGGRPRRSDRRDRLAGTSRPVDAATSTGRPDFSGRRFRHR